MPARARQAELFVAPMSMTPVTVAPAMSTTVTGVGPLLEVGPLPSLPSASSPQQITVPPLRRAQVYRFPPSTWTASMIPATLTAYGWSAPVVSTPSWSLLLLPQHATVPSPRTAHE